MKEPLISVVIPCFDELANLQKGVMSKVLEFFEKKQYSYEIIVVDDGSRDGSERFVEKIAHENTQVRLLKNNHTGKAGAVTVGMLAAKGRYILFTDMDQATPIEEIEKLLPYLEKGYTVVIGSRSGTRKGAPWTRLLMARGMMILRTIIVGLSGINDTQCGFKVFQHDAAEKIFRKMQVLHHGFGKIKGSNVTAGFDVELLYLAQKMGYKIKEVPVQWLYVETRRVNPVKDSLEGVKELFRIRLNQIQGKY